MHCQTAHWLQRRCLPPPLPPPVSVPTTPHHPLCRAAPQAPAGRVLRGLLLTTSSLPAPAIHKPHPNQCVVTPLIMPLDLAKNGSMSLS